jgi:hypothetical protein
MGSGGSARVVTLRVEAAHVGGDQLDHAARLIFCRPRGGRGVFIAGVRAGLRVTRHATNVAEYFVVWNPRLLKRAVPPRIVAGTQRLRPVDFHRGLELFGQHASRLNEPGYREAVARYGIIVVEGFNDVLGLDALGIPAVAIMSNKITDEQVAKVERWARQLADGKVTLLFDADEAGDIGAREALWLFAQRGLDVRLGWSQAMHGGKLKGRQPESLTRQDWETTVSILRGGQP